MFDLATIDYNPARPDGYRYNVRLSMHDDERGGYLYTGNGRFCPTLEAAREYARTNARMIETRNN